MPRSFGVMNWFRITIVLGFMSGCHHGESDEHTLEAHPTHTAQVSLVHQSPRLSGVDVGRDDSRGEPIRVRCETCHSMRKDAPMPTRMASLSEFHSGLTFAHGTIECSSCHAVGQPPQLRLASGELVPVRDALRLCAQCHGPQFRDYQHGAHGGMTGYWDVTRGERVRNHCVDCHDPHVPQITPVVPVPPPRDRFFSKGEHQ